MDSSFVEYNSFPLHTPIICGGVATKKVHWDRPDLLLGHGGKFCEASLPIITINRIDRRAAKSKIDTHPP